jgi:hypothetical protein
METDRISRYVVKSGEKGKEAFEANVFSQNLIFEPISTENFYSFHSSSTKIGHGRDLTSILSQSSQN